MTPARIRQLERLGLLRVRRRRSRATHAPLDNALTASTSQTPSPPDLTRLPPSVVVAQNSAAPPKRPTRPTSYWDTEITRCIRQGVDPRRISVDKDGDLLILES
jgi:hypothetical protein